MLTVRSNRKPADLLVRGARVVDPATGRDEYLDVSVRGGVVAAVGKHLSLSPGQSEVDCAEGATAEGSVALVPAFVDPHVHVREPGGAGTESIASGTAAAAHGGYCAIVSMPNTNPVLDSPELLRSLRAQAAEDAIVPIGFAAAITAGQLGEQLAELRALVEAGAMLLSDDGRPVASAALLRRAMQYQLVASRPLALHCEQLELAGSGVMHEGAVSALLGLEAQPSLAESLDVARNVRLAISEGARVHLQHLSAIESVEELAWAKAQVAGGRGEVDGRIAHVTGEASPHHLLLTDEAVLDLDPATSKMNPPLRSAADRAALVAALRDGTIDCIATDHAPHGRDAKAGTFESAPFGVTGLETAFAALNTGLVEPGVLTLTRLVEAMSSAPARVLGIPAPSIAEGARADFALVDLAATWTPGEEEWPWASKATNNAFTGRTLRGRVLATIAAGAVAFSDPAMIARSEGDARPLVGTR